MSHPGGLMRALRTTALLIPFALTASLTAQPARQATAGDVLPFKATERTLANGLKVIIVPTGFPNIVSIQIPVQTGSRNEVEPGKSGFAHFFEHLMFRGTPATLPQKYREIMVNAGARDPRRVQQEQRRAAAQALRGPARAVLPGPHLQAHDDGLHQGHREHAERVRVLEAVLPALVSPAVHDARRRRRRHRRAGDADDREVLGRVGGRRAGGGRDPEGARAEGTAVRPRALDERDAALGDGRVPRARVRREEQGRARARYSCGALLRADLR